MRYYGNMNRYSRTDKTSYCLGMSLTIEAIRHQHAHIRQVILSEKVIRNKEAETLFSLCEKYDIPYIYDDTAIARLSAKENCYCIGVFDKYETHVSSHEHVVLYDFHDLNDLGTIIRSAVSFDFKDLILIGSDIDIFDPACIRASMGAIFQTAILHYEDMDAYLKAYPRQKLYVFSTEGNKELNELKLQRPFSLMIAQDPHELDHYDGDLYQIRHHHFNEISLAIRSSLILEKAYEEKRIL